MNVTFADRSFPFRPWRPDAKPLVNAYAFDTETTLIDEAHDWLPPAYVIAAAFDGLRGYFVTRDHVDSFFRAHRDLSVAMHNAPFDLAVIHASLPDLDIYGWVDRNRVWDTQLLHRLFALGVDGHTASGKGESSLEHCVRVYLGCELPKDVTDTTGNIVRTSYGRWLRRPPEDIEPVYLEYLAKDVIATRQVRVELGRRLPALLRAGHGEWGFVSPEWLEDQIRRWGPQTHHIQLRAAIALRAVTANGLHLDMARRGQLATDLQDLLNERRQLLAGQGFLPGAAGSNKALQSIFRRLQKQHPEMSFPKTETGQFATAFDAISELAGAVLFVRQLLEYREVEKLLNSFVTKMGKPVLHPSFNVLARSGRTSSLGDINAQNLPTDDRVRSCFVPSPGHVFIDADYKTIELATLAQSCLKQFGLDSAMADAINAGKDLHTLVAARVTGKSETEVSKEERKKAKPINFGKPGGMSNNTLKAYAKVNYGVELDDNQVEDLSNAWFTLFPEMEDFLSDDTAIGTEVAELLGLTPASHQEHTGSGRFANHPANAGRGNLPNRILGGMCLKTLKCEEPRTGCGDPYRAADLDYFWVRLSSKIDSLSPRLRQAVRNRQPSLQLQKAVMGLVGRAAVFTLTGRLRANASYCARHNTVFQGLAADGMKLALWGLWRAGYRIANEVHDQFLIEVPAKSDLKGHADGIRALMIEGMSSVVPDVKVDVTYAATDRWHKEAEAVFDEASERLLVWQPPMQATDDPPRSEHVGAAIGQQMALA